MVWKELDADDPFEAVAMAVPVAGEEALKEMALAFAEELIGMGWSDTAVAYVFRQPFYRGPYMVYRRKGEAFVQEVIQQAKARHLERLARFRRQQRREEVDDA